jgi:RHS repeat-associated protein
VAADRPLLEASHALPLVATVHIRTAALHSDEAGGSMQLAQAAKEKMHAPVFSLAASAAAIPTTKSEGTNPIPQPDARLGQHVFFKTNPTFQLVQNSRLGHQLPTAVLYQGLGPAISTTATDFAHSLYDSRVRPRCTGKERDAETGLDYFGARYFSGAQGRFTSPDEFKGGIVDPFSGQDIETNTALQYADITDPQTLNKYAYVRNNPGRYVDPNGHFALVDDAAEGAIIIGAAVTLTVAAYLAQPSNQKDLRAAVNTAVDKIGSAINNIFRVPSKVKEKVEQEAGGKCEYCGVATTKPEKSKEGVKPSPDERQTDHYDPKAKGGGDEEGNLRNACRKCNRDKSDTPPKGTKWELPPKTPPLSKPPNPTGTDVWPTKRLSGNN